MQRLFKTATTAARECAASSTCTLKKDSLSALLESLAPIKVTDLGLSSARVEELMNWKSAVSGASAARSPPVYYMDIYEDDELQLNSFLVPPGAVLPLHDHPGMTVFSKILYGDLHTVSLDIDKEKSNEDSLTAVVTLNHTLRVNDVTYLQPERHNLHYFASEKGCLFMDVLVPPYDWTSRPCTFYATTEDLPSLAVGDTTQLQPLSAPRDYWNVVLSYGGKALKE